MQYWRSSGMERVLERDRMKQMQLVCGSLGIRGHSLRSVDSLARLDFAGSADSAGHASSSTTEEDGDGRLECLLSIERPGFCKDKGKGFG